MSATLSESELKKLIKKAQNGDTQAFGKMYDHFFTPVYRYVTFRVSADLAEDIVADIFVKAWEKLGTYKPQRNVPFGAWIFRIARHTLIDAYRAQQMLEEVPEDLVDEDEFNQTEALVKRKHLRKVVRGAMDNLPTRYKDVLELSFMAELPNDEVARVLRIREGSVRTLKFRALKKLETLLPIDTV